MPPFHDDIGSPQDLAQLLRLRAARAATAERRVAEQQRACDDARAVVDEAARRHAEGVERVRRHAAHRVGDGAADLPRFSAIDAAFQEDLGDARDRAEYDAIDGRETLAEEEGRLLERQRAWARERVRLDAVADALRRSRAAQALALERAADHETEDARRSRWSALTGSAR